MPIRVGEEHGHRSTHEPHIDATPDNVNAIPHCSREHCVSIEAKSTNDANDREENRADRPDQCQDALEIHSSLFGIFVVEIIIPIVVYVEPENLKIWNFEERYQGNEDHDDNVDCVRDDACPGKVAAGKTKEVRLSHIRPVVGIAVNVR